MNTHSEFVGEYLGFTYNGVHSSELGIVRTSNGSRFDEGLLPTIQDKTVPVPGGDGTYYFGSYYTQKQFTVSIAFDSLTAEQLETMRTLFGDKQIHDLIFDEAPYKIYSAKVTGTATIKHIPFDENDKRVYKGEGSIQFTCYSPYAICKTKYLNEYSDSLGRAWKDSSGLLDAQDTYDKINDQGKIRLYNPGVKDADWRMTISTEGSSGISISLNEPYENRGLVISWDEAYIPDQLIIDTKANLVKWEDEIYNEYIVEGDFFKIPMHKDTTSDLTMSVTKLEGTGAPEATIEYNYYYF